MIVTLSLERLKVLTIKYTIPAITTGKHNIFINHGHKTPSSKLVPYSQPVLICSIVNEIVNNKFNKLAIIKSGITLIPNTFKPLFFS